MPLSGEEMRVALRRGLGRALLHARSYGVERDRELVLAACLRNPAWDPQSEVARANWMVEFLDEGLAAEFLARMDSPERTSQAYYQSRLALLLAHRGREGAREALYARFLPHDYDLIGAQEILGLDGEAGLRRLLLRLRDFGEPELIPDWVEKLEYYYERDHGEGSARALIQAEFPYLNPVLEEDASIVESAARRLPPLSEVLECIDYDRSCGIDLGYLGTLVTPEVFVQVFQRFERPLAGPQLVRLLHFFSLTGFPELRADLLAYADHPSSKVRWWAIHALSYHEVRELALRCLRKKRWRAGEVALLKKSYLPGDEVLLRPLLQGDDHRLISDLRDLCSAHRCLELLEVMMFVYESSTCLNCRQAVIEVMRELEIFPDWAAEEHRFDALTFSRWN